MATTLEDEEEKKRLEAEAQARATSSLASTAKNAVQVQSFPQSTPEVRNQVMNEQAASISGLRNALPNPILESAFGRIQAPATPEVRNQVMNEQAANINSLRDTLPSPIKMGPFAGSTTVNEAGSAKNRADVNNTINTDKAAQYLQSLTSPKELPLDARLAQSAMMVPIGNGALASQATANNIAASRRDNANAKAQYDFTLKNIRDDVAPLGYKSVKDNAKAANMTDEAGQKAGIARYNNFTQGIADREQDGRDVQQEMRLSKDQLAMAKANIQNIKRAQARGEVVNPAHIAAAHDYLSRADRRTGGTVNIDEQKRQAGSNVKLYRDDSIAFNKKYGISNEDYSRPKNDMAQVAAPVAAPVALVKKPEERGRYSRVSPWDSIIGKV